MTKGPLKEFALLLALPTQALQLHLHSRELFTPIVGLSWGLANWLADHGNLRQWRSWCWGRRQLHHLRGRFNGRRRRSERGLRLV